MSQPGSATALGEGRAEAGIHQDARGFRLKFRAVVGAARSMPPSAVPRAPVSISSKRDSARVRSPPPLGLQVAVRLLFRALERIYEVANARALLRSSFCSSPRGGAEASRITGDWRRRLRRGCSAGCARASRFAAGVDGGGGCAHGAHRCLLVAIAALVRVVVVAASRRFCRRCRPHMALVGKRPPVASFDAHDESMEMDQVEPRVPISGPRGGAGRAGRVRGGRLLRRAPPRPAAGRRPRAGEAWRQAASISSRHDPRNLSGRASLGTARADQRMNAPVMVDLSETTVATHPALSSPGARSRPVLRAHRRLVRGLERRRADHPRRAGPAAARPRDRRDGQVRPPPARAAHAAAGGFGFFFYRCADEDPFAVAASSFVNPPPPSRSACTRRSPTAGRLRRASRDN